MVRLCSCGFATDDYDWLIRERPPCAPAARIAAANPASASTVAAYSSAVRQRALASVRLHG
jgi:hypothetical protein